VEALNFFCERKNEFNAFCFFSFSLTLVDTLDTLAVLGLHDEFEEAVKRVEKDVRFETDVTVSVFETIIRVLG